MRLKTATLPLIASALLAAALSTALAGADDAAPKTEQVTGKAALEALVSGRTQYRDRSDGTSEIEYHSPDGRSAYVWDNCIERGQWWATDDQICFFYPDTTLQGPHCFWIKRNAKDQLEFWWSGDPGAPLPTATTIEDLPGNVEHLPLDSTGECIMS